MFPQRPVCQLIDAAFFFFFLLGPLKMIIHVCQTSTLFPTQHKESTQHRSLKDTDGMLRSTFTQMMYLYFT